MLYLRVVGVIGALGLVGCATANDADVTDARRGVDPVPDGPEAEPDAAEPDAAAPDAASLDAPAVVIDARPPIDAAPVVIDAPLPIDAGTVVGSTDTCAQPPDITTAAMAATGVTLTGSTAGFANDIAMPNNTCTGYPTAGPDAIYALDLPAGRTITATAAGSWDIALMLVTPCSTTPTCLRGDDNGLSGVTESVTYATPAAGRVYVVVDGYNASANGAYSLTVRVQ